MTLLALTALLALLVPAAAASAKTSKKTPSITRVSPMRVGLKGTITIRGKHFSSRRVRNTVIFRAPDGRTAFIKPTRASSRKLVVKVPAAVTRLFSHSGSKQLPTRFKLRVLSGRFSKFTVRRLSPVIVPAGFSGLGPLGGGSGGSGSVPACGTGSDWDGDLLS
ncbi:MAG TPA: IPT/TIG domain-containing protein, partial [Thermoleophilaceae bacterium]